MDDLDKYDLVAAKLVIVVASSTGDGDSPDNSLKFWRNIRKVQKAAADGALLPHCHFTVLGLGDSNYSNFGGHPLKVEKKFLELGAKAFYPKEIVDEVEGLEAQVEVWIDGLWASLEALCARKEVSLSEIPVIVKKSVETEIQERLARVSVSGTKVERSDVIIAAELPFEMDVDSVTEIAGVPKLQAPKCQLKLTDKVQNIDEVLLWCRKSYLDALPSGQEHTQSSPSLGKIVSAQCLTAPDTVKRTIVVDLDIQSLKWNYFPGDAIGFHCPNNEHLVSQLAEFLNLKPSQTVIFSPDPVDPQAFPSHIAQDKELSIHDLFTYYLDLTTFPRKAFFRSLAEHASEEDKKRILIALSKQGATVFKNWMNYAPTVLDILKTFPSLQSVPLSVFVDHLQPLQPRYFSIANSPLTSTNTVRLVFNIVDYEIEFPKNVKVKRFGVATTWLDKVTDHVKFADGKVMMKQPVNVSIFPRPSKEFRVPSSPKTKMIMIGPGTGVAPFVGFIEHRRRQLLQQGLKPDASNSVLIYGCRERIKDWLFKDFMVDATGKGDVECLMAVSREIVPNGTVSSDIPVLGKYVQDVITSQSKKIIDIMFSAAGDGEHQPTIFVCGDAKGMAQGVQAALQKALIEHGKCSTDMDAIHFLATWMKQGRYIRDVWA